MTHDEYIDGALNGGIIPLVYQNGDKMDCHRFFYKCHRFIYKCHRFFTKVTVFFTNVTVFFTNVTVFFTKFFKICKKNGDIFFVKKTVTKNFLLKIQSLLVLKTSQSYNKLCATSNSLI